MRKPVLTVACAGLAIALASAQSRRVAVTFTPEKPTEAFTAAVEEYRRIWAEEGDRIIRTMEQVTKLKFPDKSVKAEIYEGPSFSGRGNAPMKLRASYSADVKKGTLVHELGHRINAQLKKRPLDLDEHRLLILYLYDLYEELYGKEFADSQVAFGKTLKGLYDYDAAWNWALGMSKDERLAKYSGVLKANGK